MGRLLFDQIVKMDLEGITSKEKDSPYRAIAALALPDQGEKFALQPIRRA